jgi:hypothetical protein
MALTNAGMTPSINGDSIKARSPTAVGGTNDDSLDHWGFNAEGHSSYTGSDPMFMHNSHARRRSDPRVTNPYIEMRRKRTDMRLFRQHLTSFGSLPQRNPELDESRFQRIRTPDREHCLNISQLASDLPPDPSFVLNFPTLSLESRANYLGLNNRERSRLSARALAESLGLDVNKRVRASNMRLRTPELPTYLSRRRLDAARDDSPKEGSAGSLDTRHSGLKLARVLIPSSEGMRPRVIDRAATTSSTGRRPSINDGSSELQPSLQPLQPFLYPLQTQDGIRYVLSERARLEDLFLRSIEQDSITCRVLDVCFLLAPGSSYCRRLPFFWFCLCLLDHLKMFLITRMAARRNKFQLHLQGRGSLALPHQQTQVSLRSSSSSSSSSSLYIPEDNKIPFPILS